jgi:glutaredoxin
MSRPVARGPQTAGWPCCCRLRHCRTRARAAGLTASSGPTASVTFSDQPPQMPQGHGRHRWRCRGQPLRQCRRGWTCPSSCGNVASRYPVTLYTGNNCAPCVSAAATFLQGRGIPFTERTVTTPEDADALQRPEQADSSLPFLTIGGQQIAASRKWNGHSSSTRRAIPRPRSCPRQLPQPARRQLVAVQTKGPPPARASPRRLHQPLRHLGRAGRGTAPANPAGIRF